jgi:hypothetical protein
VFVVLSVEIFEPDFHPLPTKKFPIFIMVVCKFMLKMLMTTVTTMMMAVMVDAATINLYALNPGQSPNQIGDHVRFFPIPILPLSTATS